MSLINRTKHLVFEPGNVIMRQGDLGEVAYLIEDGQVEIFVTNPDGTEQILGHRGTGTIIGEMALVDNKVRTASIRATRASTLIAITREDFGRRLAHADPVMKMVMQVILARYRAVLHGTDSARESAEEMERDAVVSQKAFETIRMTHDFREAILGYQLRLHYQPIIDIVNDKVVGFEALMRWHHPVKGMVSPGTFIPLAEDSGLIVHASRWALREGVYMLNRLKLDHGMTNDWFMSLNFTGLDLAAEDFADNVSEAMQGTGVHPSRIKLEITERMLIDDPEGAIATLKRCRDAGLTVALDDFGTGYSSLSYLHKFPIDTMKIDRSFIVEMVQSPASLTLVKTIISLAKGLGMSVVAEGVEKKEELDLLMAHGCDMVQGYYFARPMQESDLVLWLEKRK
ncbi:MAG: EAL domain-containing protein [Alphaproteobacteria bacterium]|nr:EAL domain-containing protein [Alphaproteobacteria bacterium]